VVRECRRQLREGIKDLLPHKSNIGSRLCQTGEQLKKSIVMPDTISFLGFQDIGDHSENPQANGTTCYRDASHSSATIRSILILAVLSLSGCVAVHWRDQAGNIQHSGALRYSIIETDSARIFLTESLGLDLRLAPYDPGLSVGYRKYLSVHPKPAGLPQDEQEGYFWIKESKPDVQGLYLLKVVGTDLGFNLLCNGFTIGYDRTTIIVGPTPTESVMTKIDFAEDNLYATHYYFQPGAAQ
jgi:hypothetical protein